MGVYNLTVYNPGFISCLGELNFIAFCLIPSQLEGEYCSTSVRRGKMNMKISLEHCRQYP